MSNSSFKSCCLATSSTRITKSLNLRFSFLRIFRSRCSCSYSSGSYTELRALTSSDASTTSVMNWTSWVFFLPTMMGCTKLKWMTMRCSPLQGWKRACLMFAYIMSTDSPDFVTTKRRPFEWASRLPLDLRPESAGRISRSASRGQSRILTSFAWTTRSASSSCLASRCRDRFRSSWISRNALFSPRCSTHRNVNSLMKAYSPPCCLCRSTIAAICLGASFPRACPGV
mmetsp:Transcript_19351/g.56338  ORF Transcript_19351/g.56338 Transcript_19351/m.56338 type:complete len:228 (+) Transcript_19351:737-1420(+)